MSEYDILIRNGAIYDGSGGAPYRGDIAIAGDTIAQIGNLRAARGQIEIDASGLAVAPGFINMLSWSTESLIADGRSQSEIRQGVTLEVMGEGSSMGPLNATMKAEWRSGNPDIHYTLEWTTLGEYLEFLERRGVAPNITSFVGAETLRVHAIGYADRPSTPAELDQMKTLLRQAMEEGAIGLSTALIYPPGSYAQTDELVELAKVVAAYNGLYISHLRSEGTAFFAALDEFFTIARAARVRAEIYHLKAAGKSNWDKMAEVIQRIEAAQAEGLAITADMYTYPYSGTGLDTCIPQWAHEGGHKELMRRLQDPAIRARIKQEMQAQSDRWENMYYENGLDGILLAGFRQEHMRAALTGKTLREVVAMRGTPPEETIMDLIVEDDSSIGSIFFSMSEENLRRQVVLPWVSFCSDAGSIAPEGIFLKTNPHPRAYGSFARVLGKYVRDEKLVPLEEAIRRLTSFPAANLKIERRGMLKPGFFADVVVFDPAQVQDYATPAQPHQYSTGMRQVLVNGVMVLQDGEHTGAKPGRVVRGPGWQGRR